MIARLSLLALVMALAACGADGAPEKPGVTVKGEAYVGITG